ncbi:MAG: lysophospholipid acyltransferase family protein [Bacteroidales bacterium]|nr:lysophospholipid acyltransferase family protein [Bacteroidales bacterium]
MAKALSGIPFLIFRGVARLLSLLPLRLLFVISDLLRPLLYHVVRYRRNVVRQNLLRSFTEKSHGEIVRIERAYYRHLCDMFMEVIHIMHASPEKAKRMSHFRNIDLINSYFDQGRSVVLAAGHLGNWEVFNTLSMLLKHRVIAAYKPTSNKRFERFINTNRSRFGCVPVSMYDVARTAIEMNNNGQPFFLVLFADQTPSKGEIRYWLDFLNQDTPVFLGPEKIARKVNQPVVFGQVYKPRRGYYEVEFEVIAENPKDTHPYEITQRHVAALERTIRCSPELWLWSHRRWKYTRPNPPSGHGDS